MTPTICKLHLNNNYTYKQYTYNPFVGRREGQGMDDVKCLLQLRFSMAPLCARLSLTSAKHNAPEVTGYFLKFPGKNTCRSESLNSFPKVTHRLPLDFRRRFQSSPMASLHLPGGSGRGRQACGLGGRHNWVYRPSIKCHWTHPCFLSKMFLHSVFFGCFRPHLGEGLNKLLMALSSFI